VHQINTIGTPEESQRQIMDIIDSRRLDV